MGFFLTHRTKAQKFRGKFRSIFRKKIRSSKKIFRAKFTLHTCHSDEVFSPDRLRLTPTIPNRTVWCVSYSAQHSLDLHMCCWGAGLCPADLRANPKGPRDPCEVLAPRSQTNDSLRSSFADSSGFSDVLFVLYNNQFRTPATTQPSPNMYYLSFIV